MKNLFEHTSSPWIRYSSYEYRTAEDGTLYIVVSADAKPEMYNPMKDAESLVLAAVNIGLQVMHKAPEKYGSSFHQFLRIFRLYDCTSDNCGIYHL